MPDEVTGRPGFGGGSLLPPPNNAGAICRAAPTRATRPAMPRGARARSRRWLIICGIVVAALLAGASVALAATPAPARNPGHAAVYPSG
jgi:hypothetical protein